jgi:AcrR family transcriptional regulator
MEKDRRAAILQAALRCFLEKGVESTTIQDIRQRSGASTGSIYHAFSNKEAMAAEIFVDALGEWQEGLLAVIGEQEDAEQMIRKIVAYDVDWLTRAPDRARFLFLSRQSQFASDIQKRIGEAERTFLRTLKRCVAGHVEKGRIRPLAMDMLIAIVLGPATEWGRQWLAGSALSKPLEARRTLADAAWAGVRA